MFPFVGFATTKEGEHIHISILTLFYFPAAAAFTACRSELHQETVVSSIT